MTVGRDNRLTSSATVTRLADDRHELFPCRGSEQRPHRVASADLYRVARSYLRDTDRRTVGGYDDYAKIDVTNKRY